MDRTGQRFGRLVIVSLHERDVSNARDHKWIVECDCGAKKVTPARLLTTGHTKSCGCLQRELLALRNTTHGLSRHHKSTYRSWKDMRARCNNPNDSDYASYGGRGISVCQRWDDFRLFLDDMGERPEGMTIDRIDNDAGYGPDNCRWANAFTQANNKRTNRIVAGMTLQHLAEASGVYASKLAYRISAGYPVEQATNPNVDLRK